MSVACVTSYEMKITVLATLCWAVRANAQSSSITSFTELFNITAYPEAQTSNVSQYLNQASTLAGYELDDHFQRRCIIAQVYDDLSSNAQAPGRYGLAVQCSSCVLIVDRFHTAHRGL